MKAVYLSVLATLLLTLTVGAAESPIADSLGGKLVAVQGKRLAPFDAKQLEQTKYFAVYFSAQWCPPCRAFTPKLVEFYNRIKPQHPEFELIFMSRDYDEAAMLSYMVDYKMPWPAVKFARVADVKKLNQHAGKGIPCLVFIDANGEVLSHSYVDGKYVGPGKVLNDIEATLRR